MSKDRGSFGEYVKSLDPFHFIYLPISKYIKLVEKSNKPRYGKGSLWDY